MRRGTTAGLVYTVAGAVQRGLPILLLPIYAAALAPAEYGQVAILIAAATVLGSIMSLGLEASVVRETVRLADAPGRRESFLNSIGWFTIVAPVVAALGVSAIALTIGGFDATLVLLAALSVAIQSTLTVFVGAALRSEERLGAYLGVTVAYAIVTALATLGFLFVAHAGPAGWFAGSLVGGVVALGFGLAALGHRWSREISWIVIRSALVFGLPLLPHALAHWVLNLSDRLLIGAFAGDAAVGVYNLAYQAAAPILLVMMAAHQSVMPLYPRAIEDAATRERLRGVLTGHVHLALWLGMVAALLAPPVIAWAFPPAYTAATAFVPWIALGYVCFGLYLIPMDSMSLLLGRTRWVWIPTVCAAATNLALNLAYIPSNGPAAAAVATAAAYGVLLVGVVIARRRMAGPRIEYQTRAMALGAIWVAALTGAGLVAFPTPDDLGGGAARTLLVVVAGVGLLAADRRRTASDHSLHSEPEAKSEPRIATDDALTATASRV